MTDQPPINHDTRPERFHTYTTHHIPWYVRAMWIAFWIGGVWYLIKFGIPMAKNYF